MSWKEEGRRRLSPFHLREKEGTWPICTLSSRSPSGDGSESWLWAEAIPGVERPRKKRRRRKSFDLAVISFRLLRVPCFP
jgi:hypothetical protein